MRVIAPVALALLVGCADDRIDLGPRPGLQDTYVRAMPKERLDVLFVVDNSVSMNEEQDGLALRFQAFVAELEALPGGIPDLHLGVVSTDVGIGIRPLGNCDGEGDDGALLRDARCAIEGSFIRHERDADGTVATNYEGELAEAFGCMARLGTSGCGFEQPLESMRRALGNPLNEGFLRDDAVLAVVLLGDEDDCSASDPDTVFDTRQDTLTSELGFMESYRCFEFGVVCDPDAPRDAPEDGTPVAQADCRPRDDSPYVTQVGEFVDFLRQLRPDPMDLSITAINGDPAPVAISRTNIDDDHDLEMHLEPSCTSSAFGTAAPAIRLAAFAEAFGPFGRFASICGGDLGPVLTESARQVGQAMGSTCLLGALTDAEPAVPGTQPRCQVDEVIGLGSPSEQRRRLAPCDRGGAGPCYRLEADAAQCAHQPSRLRLAVDHDGEVDPRTVYLARCDAP